MVTLNELDATEAAARLARRELRAEDLLRDCLARIVGREPAVRAFAAIDADAAFAQARALDAGPIRGPLHGLPIGVKDILDTAELPTTYGSSIFTGHRPALDAAAVALCREAGAVIVGKTVSTEFAYFTPGPTRNPHDLGHTPGGSSSGSAAAVADRMLPLALGTQTAGSIIRPAAFCGVVGIKPGLARVPKGGTLALSDTMDAIGGFGRSVADAALLLSVLTGDARMAALPDDLPVPRIGLAPTPDFALVDTDTQRAWEQARAALAPHADLGDVAWPAGMPDLVALQKEVQAVEMARELCALHRRHRERLSERLRALIDEGLAIPGERHADNLARTHAARARIDTLFKRFDVLLAPSTIGEAPAGLAATGDPLFCRGWSLLGLPCVHLPFANGSQGLPIGLQLVGRFGEDLRLLAFARGIHQRLLANPTPA
jgi:Asp-tRNA(Asn)/Glu-tRNA(Gln) amidotransferase A subunit family amidase